jgi:hypothetical protein
MTIYLYPCGIFYIPNYQMLNSNYVYYLKQCRYRWTYHNKRVIVIMISNNVINLRIQMVYFSIILN